MTLRVYVLRLNLFFRTQLVFRYKFFLVFFKNFCVCQSLVKHVRICSDTSHFNQLIIYRYQQLHVSRMPCFNSELDY